MDHKELGHRFAHHPPRDDATVEIHQQLRQSIGDVADEVNHIVPEGREKSLAITKLEEALMWSNAAVARNQGL